MDGATCRLRETLEHWQERRVKKKAENSNLGDLHKPLGICVQEAGEKSGQLNPAWVEWLLGWPEGASDWLPLETARFQQWLLSHGMCCGGGSVDR